MYYEPVFDKKTVEYELSKLKKLNYNKFRWWRMYEDTHTPLPNKSSFIDKILNGDFNPSLYMWQVYLVEHELNEIWNHSKNDMSMFLENTSVQRARRKRLREDFEKEEGERMFNLYEHFFQYFNITREQLEEEMLECCGDIKDLYYIVDTKYTNFVKQLPIMEYILAQRKNISKNKWEGPELKPVKRRGRPKKYENKS